MLADHHRQIELCFKNPQDDAEVIIQNYLSASNDHGLVKCIRPSLGMGAFGPA